jgi:glucokinase
MAKKLVVGDIGGTNTTLGIFNVYNKKLSNIVKVKTKDLDLDLELSNLVKNKDISGISLAVAGPVVNSSVSMTNTSKKFSSKVLSKKFGLDVLLLNDFEALGFYVKSLGDNNALVVGAGTGLGKVLVLDKVIASEGGNQDFPFFASENKLNDFFSKKLNRVPEYEDLISGAGLSLLKEFHSGNKLSSSSLNPENIFLKRDDSLNKKVINDFSRFYARFIKNAYSDFLPSKVFVAGGIARRNPDILKSSFFSSQLKHRFLKKPKIVLIKDNYAGLIGASFAFEHKNI